MWSPWTSLVIPGLFLALVHPTRPNPDPDLRINFCAWPQTCFIFRHLTDDFPSTTCPAPWLAWWDRPWLAWSCLAGHSIPLSSWLPSLMEQLALMSPRKNPAHERTQDTKMISKKIFGLYSPQVISRAYLWTLSIQSKTQEPKDVRSFPSGSHLIHQPALRHHLDKERCVGVLFMDAKSRITLPCVRVKDCNNVFLGDNFLWML